MAKKQTAMQELIKEMESLQDKPYINPKNALKDCIHLAYSKLQMEREQIVQSNVDGQDLHSKHVTTRMMQDNAEQYFTETYQTNQ